MARLYHEFCPAASSGELSALKDFVDPFGADIRAIYEKSNGMHLFVDRIRDARHGDVAAFEFFPVGLWAAKREEAARLMVSDDWPFKAEDLFLIGTPCNSGNLLALLGKGENKGAIIYLDPDGGDGSILATSLGRFFDKIAQDPVALIRRLGSYTRYYDGATDEQWIPSVYLPNASEQLAKLAKEG